MSGGYSLWGEIADEGSIEDEQESMQQEPAWNEAWRPVSCNIPQLYNPPPIQDQATPTNSLLNSAIEMPRNAQSGNVILHSIELKQYIEEMKQLITSSSEKDTNNSMKSRETLIAPAPPNQYWPNTSNKRWEKSEAQKPHQASFLPQFISLDSTNLYLLRRKAIATICLHAGYETSTGRSLSCLADILGNYLKRFCSLLRINTDSSCGNENFEGVLEKTLLQLDAGGKRGIKQYWDSLVREHSALMEDAADQMEEFKLVMGAPTVIDKAKLLKNMSLPLKKKGSFISDSYLTPSWIANTPMVLGEEEIAINSEINLENVAVARTPDLTGNGFMTLTDREVQDGTLPLDTSPPRKKLRTLSFTNE